MSNNDETRPYRRPKHSDINWYHELGRVATVLIPVVITFLVFVSKLDTRVTVLEQTVPDKIELQEAVRLGVEDAIDSVMRRIADHEERIRDIERGGR